MLSVLENGSRSNVFFHSKLFWENVKKCRSTNARSKSRKWSGVNGGKRFYTAQSSPKNIVHSPLGELKVPKVPFHEFITENWSLWEGKTAVECVKSGKKYTYRDIKRYSRTLAAAFQNKLKLSKGDVIAVVLPNCPEYPIIILSASLNGIIPTTVNPSYAVDEIYQQLEDCRVKLLITDSKAYDKCLSALRFMKASLPILIVKHRHDDEVPQGSINLCELFNSSISGYFKSVDVRMDDVFVLPFSSGMTGESKGVVLSHRNVVSNLAQLNHPETNLTSPTTRFTQDRTFVVLPMFHMFGLIACTFFSLREGCRLCILPSFNPGVFLSNIYHKKVNILYLVPSILSVLNSEDVKSKHLKNLRFIVNGGSQLCVRDAYSVLDKAEHVKIVQGYGLTETSPVLTHTSTKRMQKLTSVGIPIASTKLKVVDPQTGEALPKGKIGELCAWGPQVMKRYLNLPVETENSFDTEGWFKTGDIGYYDEDQDFFIVQKLMDFIYVKGFQVAPFEVEEVLRRHPKISDATVVGVPDSELGEVPRAFVIPHMDADLTEKEVKEFIRKKLPQHKHLRGGVRFLEDFPKNKIGNVLRVELKKMS